MSRRFSTLFGGAAFALYAAAGAAAYAQPAPHEVRIQRDGDTVFIRRGVDHHMDLAQHLRAVLQLKPNQEQALAAYVQALEPPKHDMVLKSDDHGAPKTTPERLAEMEKMMAAHQQAMHARIEATRRFYDQLDPAQKRAFDELHMDGPAMGHGGMMRMITFDGPAPLPPMPPMPPAPGL